jgi:endonuclease YncB( thermonuclease family)
VLPAVPASAGVDFPAKVVSVEEGDRVIVYHAGRHDMLSLKDIDCPHPKQPYGKQAKNATAAYIGGREVLVRGLVTGRDGRKSAEILLQDGRNLGHELIKEGLAWSRPLTQGDPRLGEMEELARAAGKGLWADPHPVPPWKWKATKNTKRRYSN